MRKYPDINPRLGDLIIHISQGNTAEVMEMIRSDPHLINAEHPSETTPLFFAVRHQVPLITQYLIENGANVNPPLPGRESLTQMADGLPDQDILDALLDAGGRAKTRRKIQGESMPVFPTIAELTESDLPLCASVGKQAQFKRVAKDFSLRRLRQLLSVACREQAESLAKCLIRILPSVDYCTEDEDSPLLNAALSGSLILVRELRKAGAKTELIGTFDFAVERGHVAIVRELLAEIQQKKYKNYSERELPRMAERSAKRGYTVMAELLLPFASKRSATITRRLIDDWRDHYHDLVPQCFSWPHEDTVLTQG
ncbi:ankyrin repeat domain-containing protein [Rubripirellula sp.]|nr:ankyrin repeat domain-containing protein [Rubripirellula sp.]